MAKYYLGIGGFAHDCAAALFRNGELIAAAPEERFTRIKHQPGIPWNAIDFCLDRAGIEPSDVTTVCHAFTRRNIYKYASIQAMGSFRYPEIFFRKTGLTEKAQRVFRLAYLVVQNQIGLNQLLNRFARSSHEFVYHHNAHAAAVFLTSPHENGTILVIDSNGDGASTTLYDGTGRKLTRKLSVPFPHSLGNYYLTFTRYLGFPGGDEYKVMGLASYGKPRFRKNFEELFSWLSPGEYRMNLKFFTHQGVSGEQQFSRALIDKFGPPIHFDGNLNERAADMAASVQAVLEDIVVETLHSSGLNGKVLCIGGGVAQNSVLNGRLTLLGKYQEVRVPPWVTDAGTAIGAAAYVAHQQGFEPVVPEHDYWGPDYSEEEIEKAFRRINVHPRKFESRASLLEYVACHLADGKIVGWFQGRAEFGERALGNRSILADPRRTEMKDLVNERIKFREEFRPFAPSILQEYYSDYSACSHPSPFMTHVFDVRPEKRGTIPAVTHVDGTGRFQSVSKEANPLYYDLIDTFRGRTGVPVLLNTSFNVKGEPIVASPSDALRTFYNSGMDLLVIGDYVIDKNQPWTGTA
jgi:carbamoyltransferase